MSPNITMLILTFMSTRICQIILAYYQIIMIMIIAIRGTLVIPITRIAIEIMIKTNNE